MVTSALPPTEIFTVPLPLATSCEAASKASMVIRRSPLRDLGRLSPNELASSMDAPALAAGKY